MVGITTFADKVLRPDTLSPSTDDLRPKRSVDAETVDAKNWRDSIAAHYEARITHSTRNRSKYYYRRIQKRLKHMIEPGSRVLDIGCGDGELLASLDPAQGVGVDICKGAIQEAKRRFPQYRFAAMPGESVESLNDTFDYVIISQTLDEIYDLRSFFRTLGTVCHARTRVIVVQYNRLWQPILKVAEWFKIKQQAPPQNWVPTDELKHLLDLGEFETVSLSGLTIAPIPIPLFSELINRTVANLPLVHYLGLNDIVVARPVNKRLLQSAAPKSVSIIVPACNEAGHIESLLKRTPLFAERQEIIFVEGGSKDDTWDVIQQVVRDYDGPFEVSCMQQDGKGKGDAVRKGFAAATGDVLMILDADISVPPEELPAFYEAIATGKGEFINGSRMVYLMDSEAMRFLNLLANKTFGWLFTYLLSQRFRDTLCGTKVISRQNYQRVAENRSYFGDFDPFGDFDLLFGAARLKLKIIDVPVHYKARTYGTTNISRFRHGLLLLRMCWFAARKIRFI